ncbi:7-ethoxycoumarin O-deethylase-like [Cynara cardunculus var. scolymus]|uniref:7-ethoxycoumarin O-deethylase-like n=1 Tax=Cynara cardunculus var. scolymus TaxID=59895 RepID=UPI000D62FDF9|nr:7-ethoxycoumarin O-deethylase-like [Cynara cardunculus var. scolymus]
MEFVTIVLGFFLLFALIQATFSVLGLGRPKNLPPGPTPFPIIGNLHLLGDHPNQSLAKLAKIHGPIMFLKLGRINTLVISSAAAAKEVLQKQDLAFSSRQILDSLHAHNHAQNSTFSLPVGAQWRTLRRILNNNIFSGDSLDASQHLRNQKVQELVAYCRKASECNETVDIGRAAYRTSLNIASNTIFSKDLTDPFEDSGQEFKELIGNIMMEAVKPNLVDVFPVLKKIDPQRIRSRLSHHLGKVLEIFEELIKERLVMKKRLKQDDDFLDKCLKISQENPDEISRQHITSMFLDLFLAGTDTISSSLEWALTELIRNPCSMAKAKEELETTIGKGKILEEVDLMRLPYLRGIAKETLRIHPPAPFLVPRKLETQVKLYGYTIPKGTQVLVNAWAIGRDPTTWEDSLEFKPERFLTSGIDIQGHDFELIPFGAGRRICPGLPLAIRMIPLMLGSLLNNFDWNLDNGIRPGNMDMTEKFGLTLQKANPLCVVPKPLH